MINLNNLEKEIKLIFKKINKNDYNNLNTNNEFNKNLENYIYFLNENDYCRTTVDIYNILYKLEFTHFFFDKDEKLDIEEKSLLLSLFIIKSGLKININETINDIFKITTDSYINKFFSSYTNFYIFYYQTILNQEDLKKIRGVFFKIINILINEKIILSEKTLSNNKTTEFLTLGFKKINFFDYNNLKISFTPYNLIILEENYFLIGIFFEQTKKIFIENIKSNCYFKLNDLTYIQNILNSNIFLNINDLKDINNIFIKKGINMENIENTIFKKNEEIKKNINIIKEFKNDFRKKTLIDSNKKSELFIKNEDNIGKRIIEIFTNYIEKEISSFYINNEYNLNKILNKLYKEFIKNFSNAYFKNTFENKEELEKWKKELNEYGISNTDFNNGNVIKKKNGINAKIKINPNKINFITYIIIYSKKEIKKMLKKIIKKNEEICIEGVKNIENIENIDIKKTVSIINIKYNINYDSIWLNKITELEDKNKELFSIISKKMKIYDLFLLEKKIIERINDLDVNCGNIKIFFTFFFDFRGRFYYDSVISPTNNRFCRLIYNYGIKNKNEIIINESRITPIIEKKKEYINLVKKIFEIDDDSIMVNESIFWIMISLGKIIIDKTKKKIEIEEFLIKAVEIINNKPILKELDEAEYNHYIKIINSFKNEKIILRCLIKDATASFFQNLIRILGSKDNEYLKIANLDSETHWYDWYTHIIDKWREKNNYNNSIYFKRSTLKKIIMTLPYSATFPTCFEYFKNNILEEFKITVDINDNIGNEFKNFYNFIVNIMKNDGPFLNSTDEITTYFKESMRNGREVIIISKDNDLSNLTYYKMSTKHFDFIIKWKGVKKRIIKNYKEVNKNEIDVKKTLSSIKANLVHYVDALLIRDVNKEIYKTNNLCYISIHDSFMVDFTQTSNFILIINNEINKNAFKNEIWKNNKKFFSIFVFI